MKIFITGLAGFLGSHLAEALLQEGHEVHGIDNLSGGEKENVPPSAVFHLGDIRDTDLDKLLKNIDIVVHCAALPHEGLSVFAPRVISSNILDATVALLISSIKNRVKKFVFMSSMARYGSQEVPFREEMPTKPEDPYAISKVAAEKMVEILCNLHGVEWTILVPHNIIGPKQKYDDPFRNVASIMMNRIANGKPPIIYGNGEQKRCFSFIQDDIKVLKKAVFSEKAVGEIINIGPDEEFVTINNLASKIMKLMEFKGKPLYFSERPAEVRFANCSADKARKLFDYKTEFSLEEGLKSMIEPIKQKPKPFRYHISLEINNEKAPLTWRKRIM